MENNIPELMSQLENITKKMDIPEFRRKKVVWLHKNMATKNKEHPQYEEAMQIIDILMSRGVR